MAEEVEITVTLATDDPGKRGKVIANLIAQLVDAEGEVLLWNDMCEEAGLNGQSATAREKFRLVMTGLELVGAVDRYEYVEPGTTKPRAAFALAEGVKVKK